MDINTTPKEPLLTQRKVADVEANRPAEDKPVEPAKVRTKAAPVAQLAPQTAEVRPDFSEFNRFAAEHTFLAPMGMLLPPIFCIWLYIKAMNALYPYHPATHWPEPFASVAAACIEAKGKKAVSCENIFYVQVSTLLFVSCVALNSLTWILLWSLAQCARRKSMRNKDAIVGASGVAFCMVTTIGIVFSCILTFCYIIGYAEEKCGEDKLPECVYGQHPAFYAVCQWVLVESGVVVVAIYGIGACLGGNCAPLRFD